MEPITFATIVLTIFLLTNIAAFARRGQTTFQVYSADPDAYGFLPVTLSMSGSIIGGGMFLIVGQIGFEAGKTGYFYGLALALGFLTIALLAPRLRAELNRSNSTTLIELLEKRFSPRVAGLFSVLNGLMAFFMTAGQFVGLAAFCSWAAAGMSPAYLPWVLAGLCAVALSLYPIIGGARKDILTDVVQAGVVLVVVGYFALLILSRPDALQAIGDRSIGPDLDAPGYGLPFIIGGLVFMPWLYIVRLDVWQRIRAARSDTIARRAMISAAAISLLAVTVFTSLGIWAKASGLAVAGRATIEVVVLQSPNPWLASMAAAAFFSAVLTASDTYINVTALFASRVLYPRTWQAFMREPTELNGAALVRQTRRLGLVCALLAIGFAYGNRNFIDLAVGAVSLMLMFLPLVAGLLSARLSSEAGAFYGPLCGLALFLPLFFFWQPKIAFVPSVLLSLVVYGAILVAGRRGMESDGAAGPVGT